MFDVLHPTKPEMMSYDEYQKFALDLNCARLNDALPGRCPVCKREMKVKAGKEKANAHFYHNDNLFCPTKDAAARGASHFGKNSLAIKIAATRTMSADADSYSGFNLRRQILFL